LVVERQVLAVVESRADHDAALRLRALEGAREDVHEPAVLEFHGLLADDGLAVLHRERELFRRGILGMNLVLLFFAKEKEVLSLLLFVRDVFVGLDLRLAFSEVVPRFGKGLGGGLYAFGRIAFARRAVDDQERVVRRFLDRAAAVRILPARIPILGLILPFPVFAMNHNWIICLARLTEHDRPAIVLCVLG